MQRSRREINYVTPRRGDTEKNYSESVLGPRGAAVAVAANTDVVDKIKKTSKTVKKKNNKNNNNERRSQHLGNSIAVR